MMGATASRLRSRASCSSPRILAAAVVFALASFALALSGDRLNDGPLLLLVVPIAAASIAYGFKGGLSMGLLAAALAAVWWIEQASPGGIPWLTARVFTLVLLGTALGWLIDSRERLLRTLQAHSDLSLDLVATASFDGYFTRVNPAFTRTLGYTAEELMARPLIEFVHPDDVDPTLTAITEQAEAGLDVLNFQNRYRCDDGSYRWLEWTSRPNTKTSELIAVARDITQRKQFEDMEREHTRLLEEAVKERTEELHHRNAELDDARRETLRRLALAGEYRDDDTHEHTERVGQAAARVAYQLGLSDRDIELIRDAAPLHDIGKLGVSDVVLMKRGALTADEFEYVKGHTETGRTILSGSSSHVLQMAEEIAFAHHEWWDGSGYPLGLKGDEIPLAARIVAVVDVFDALTHQRPYKRAWPVDDAAAEIHRLRGTQFDPLVVDAFDRLDPYELARQTPAAFSGTGSTELVAASPTGRFTRSGNGGVSRP
jgi:PAS domain S-box-containing protein